MIKKLKTQGVEVEYLVMGKGEPILFVHGALASFRFYRKLLGLLAKHYKVYAPSLPGMGKSQSLGNKTSFESYQQTIKDLLRVEKIKPIAIGHSLGGAVIASLTAENKNLFKRLILIDSAGIPYKNFMLRNLYSWIGGYREYLKHNDQKGLLNKVLPWDIRNMVIKRPLDMIRVGMVLSHIDIESNFRKVTLPAIIMWGGDDTHFPLDIGFEISKLIESSTFVILDNREHNWVGYAPQEVLKQLQNFRK